MRISDWSSDVCSSDLAERPVTATLQAERLSRGLDILRDTDAREAARRLHLPVLVLHGHEHAILQPAMLDAVFPDRRPVAGHPPSGPGPLLPPTAPQWCVAPGHSFPHRLPGLVGAT